MKMINSTQKHHRRAIDLLSSQSALARAINLKQLNIWFCLNKTERVSTAFLLTKRTCYA